MVMRSFWVPSGSVSWGMEEHMPYSSVLLSSVCHLSHCPLAKHSVILTNMGPRQDGLNLSMMTWEFLCQLETRQGHLGRRNINQGNASKDLNCRQVCGVIILIIDGCGRAQPIMDNAAPRNVVLSPIGKQAEQANKWCSSMASVSIPASRFLPWLLLVMGYCSEM